MTTDRLDAERDDLLNEVAAVLRSAEPVPDAVMGDALGAFSWLEVSTTLASLEFDSAVDEDDDLARVRGPGSGRRLRFRGPSGVIELSIIDSGRRMIGTIVPPRAGVVELRHMNGSSTAVVDSLGHFLLEPLPRGAVSLVWLEGTEPGEVVHTEWVTI